MKKLSVLFLVVALVMVFVIPASASNVDLWCKMSQSGTQTVITTGGTSPSFPIIVKRYSYISPGVYSGSGVTIATITADVTGMNLSNALNRFIARDNAGSVVCSWNY